MLRTQLAKSLIPLRFEQSVYYSSGLTKKQLIRIRAEQKQLYGRIIRGNTKQHTVNVNKEEEEEERENEMGPIASKTADFKAYAPSQSSEFYWLIQRGGKKNVKIFRSKDIEIGEDGLTIDNESLSQEKS